MASATSLGDSGLRTPVRASLGAGPGGSHHGVVAPGLGDRIAEEEAPVEGEVAVEEETRPESEELPVDAADEAPRPDVAAPPPETDPAAEEPATAPADERGAVESGAEALLASLVSAALTRRHPRAPRRPRTLVFDEQTGELAPAA